MMNEHRATILIVDDQAENLSLLGELLQADYRVRVADSGERALRAAASDPRPDLILLDVMMPGMDGYAVLSHLQAHPALKNIPVIFVTARDSSADEERGLKLGAVDYIVKPIKPLIVLARVRTQLENKRAQDWLKDQNAFLEAEIMRRMHDNEIIQSASMTALALLAETRDSDTGKHLYRTQGYVEALARQLQSGPDAERVLSDAQMARVVKAAPLHDIGKVGIPDDILRKPGPLSTQEWVIMRSHARIGGDAIALAMQRVQDADSSAYRSDSTPLAFLEVARQIALSHHERWDGSGYPQQLQGLEIPLPARIMSLADAFDAMICRRVYKEPITMERATEIILSERARQFDPLVVDAFVSALPRFKQIAAQYAES
jgi:putative two-component system response regulator